MSARIHKVKDAKVGQWFTDGYNFYLKFSENDMFAFDRNGNCNWTDPEEVDLDNEMDSENFKSGENNEPVIFKKCKVRIIDL
jgi:hypothetical protein